jgi:hypothetical protein
MKKQQLWDIYVKKNPRFDEPDAVITLTARGLKKMFDQTWDFAEASAYEDYDDDDLGSRQAPRTENLQAVNYLKEMFGIRV